MKIKDILNLSMNDLRNLSTSELRDVVSSLADATNKRLKRLKQAGLIETSYPAQVFGGKKVSIRIPKKLSRQRRSAEGRKLQEAKIRERYRNIFRKTKNFLLTKSSTIKGARENIARVEREMNFTTGSGISYSDLSKNQKNRFWKIYNKLKKDFPQVFRQGAEKYLAKRQQIFEFLVHPTKTGKIQIREKNVVSFIEKLSRKEYEAKQEDLNKGGTGTPLELSNTETEKDSSLRIREEFETIYPSSIYKKGK